MKFDLSRYFRRETSASDSGPGDWGRERSVQNVRDWKEINFFLHRIEIQGSWKSHIFPLRHRGQGLRVKVP